MNAGENPDAQLTNNSARCCLTKTMNGTTSFVGDWLVSEYLYTPAGEYAGLIHQRRLLQQRGEMIRVVQICEPVQIAEGISPQAQEVVAIMNRRVGEFVFDLKLEGQARHYLGQDVVGSGFLWCDGVITARGIWPRFGYNFTSFSIMLAPNRQITGGTFFLANQQVATLSGVAEPDPRGFPVLAPIVSLAGFRGVCQVISSDGELLERFPVTSEDIDAMYGRMQGNRKRYGALTEWEAVAFPGQIVSAIEVSDQVSGQIAGLWKIFQDEKLHQVRFYTLTAESSTCHCEKW